MRQGAAAVADAFAGVRLSGGPATAQALVEATRCALHAEDPLATWLAWITTATGSLPFSPADAVRMELGRFDAWDDPLQVALSGPPSIDEIPHRLSAAAATPPALELAFAGAANHWVGLHVGIRRPTGWVLDPRALATAHASLLTIVSGAGIGAADGASPRYRPPGRW